MSAAREHVSTGDTTVALSRTLQHLTERGYGRGNKEWEVLVVTIGAEVCGLGKCRLVAWNMKAAHLDPAYTDVNRGMDPGLMARFWQDTQDSEDSE